jgi:hypothetical protein
VLDQFRGVLRTYNRPLHWAIVIPGMYLGGMLVVDAITTEVRKGSWVTFVLALGIMVAPVGLAISAHLANVFSSPARAKLIPGFARAQFSVAAFFTGLVTLAAVGLARIMLPGQTSSLGIAGVAIGIVVTAIGGYWGFPVFRLAYLLGFLPLVLNHYPSLREAADALGRAIVLEGKWSATVPLLLLDCVGGIAIFLRARRVDEESIPKDMTTWAQADLQAGPALPQRTLDHLEESLSAYIVERDVRSRLRMESRSVFSFATRNRAKRIAIAIAIAWALNLALRLIAGRSFTHAGYLIQGVFLLVVIISAIGQLQEWKKRLQSLLLLPVRRQELIADFGLGLVSSIFYMGLVIAALAWFLESVPSPFDIRVVSIWPFLALWSLQFPLLGLSSTVPLGSNKALLVILALALLQTVGTGIGLIVTGYAVELTIVAPLIGGALLWLSYKLWLRVEAQ